MPLSDTPTPARPVKKSANSIGRWFQSGDPMIWICAGALALALIMVIGLLLLIGVRGLGHFWPKPIIQTTIIDPTGNERVVLGEHHGSERVTASIVRGGGYQLPDDMEVVLRQKFKVGNADFFNKKDFVWTVAEAGFMSEWTYPEDAICIERTEWGDFYGFALRILENGQVVSEGEDLWKELPNRVKRAVDLRAEIDVLEKRDIGRNAAQQAQLRQDRRALEREGITEGPELERIAARQAELDAEFAEMSARRNLLRSQDLIRDEMILRLSDGREVSVNFSHIILVYRPNTMNLWNKISHYAHEFKGFMLGYPREANTEGGIFPAIFGTVTMVLLMSILVTPIGVLAAIYLREYAKQGPLVRLIRISVNNLAGVPSIVFGVFGIGFFVYFLGGNIDKLFYPNAEFPVFGTPGLFWASLTLAILTLPVVIVSTEEGLTRIPKSVREGSLALGATKSETLWKIIFPMAAPAMMTGLVLAVARAAGEVAPLMLVGVVKLAPSLPIDGEFPFLHLERKFMHLGFHIYDVGFQSPNVDAARPLVYATALILVILIVVLNLAAIQIRTHLREKFKSISD